MKPVFVSDNLGELYQTGYKQLMKMPPEQRAFLGRDISYAIAVSQHRTEGWHPAVLEHHEVFGDNKQWVGPSDLLGVYIKMAAWTLDAGQNVLVYCYYGVNRSGLVAALIIRELLRCTGAEALARLRMARKGSVGGNPHFVSYLEGLAAP
jgi:hypothetical protein